MHGATIKLDAGYVNVARTRRYSYSTPGRSRLSASQGRFCSLESVKEASVAFKADIRHTDDTSDNVTPQKQSDTIT